MICNHAWKAVKELIVTTYRCTLCGKEENRAVQLPLPYEITMIGEP